MAKPLAREQGAPIRYFYYKKYKNEPDARAANQRAHVAAMGQQMLWRAQYQRDFGRDVPNYGSRKNIPPPEREPFRPSEPKKKKRAVKKSSTSTSGRRRVSVDERTAQREQKEYAESEKGKTEELRQRKDMLDGIITQLQQDAQSGRVAGSIGQVVKGHKKNWFERNIADSFVGDVTGRAIDVISRPINAVAGMVQGGIEAGMQVSSDPLHAPQPTPDPKKNPNYGNLSAEEKAQANARYAEARRLAEKGPYGAAIEGLSGTRQYSTADLYERQLLAANNWENLPMAAKIASTSLGIGTDIAVDPLNAMGVGIRAIRGARASGRVGTTAGRTADEVVQAAEDTSRNVAQARKTSTELVRMSEANQLPPLQQIEQSAAEQSRRLLDMEAAELARTRTVEDVRRASPSGYKALTNEIKKEARRVQNLKIRYNKGEDVEDLLQSAQMRHAQLLALGKRAEKVQEASKTLPVGNRAVKQLEFETAQLSTKVDELEKIKHVESVKPRLAQARRQLAQASKRLEQARSEARLNLASNEDLVKAQGKVSKLQLDIDDLETAGGSTAEIASKQQQLAAARRELDYAKSSVATSKVEQILEAVRAMEEGKQVKVTPALKSAVADAEPNIQDRIIAAMREMEPQHTKVPDAKNPADELVGAIDAKTGSTGGAASAETIAEATRIVNSDAPRSAKTIAQSILDDAAERGRNITAPEAKALLGRELLEEMEKGAVQTPALKATEQKIAAVRAKNPLGAGAETRESLLAESMAEEVLPTMETADKILANGIGKRFYIRFAGKDLGEFRPIGSALRAAYMPFEFTGRYLRGTRAGQGFAKLFRMGAHFPGFTEDLRRAAEQSGIMAHSDFTKYVRSTFTNNVSGEEARTILRAIEDGVVLDGKLGELQKVAKAEIEKIFDQEVWMGKYGPSAKYDDYVYHYYRSADKPKIRAFKEDRTRAIRDGRRAPTVQQAKAQGLKPIDRIDEALIMHHRDYVRNLQRTNHRQSVMSTYGVMTDNPHFAAQMGLKEVTGNFLNKPFQDVAKAKKAKWYLPPEIYDTFKSMDHMMEIGFNREANLFIEGYTKFQRAFKTSATIANPGNWVNNTIGDFWLNYVDGLRSPTWYKRAASLLRAEGKEMPKTVRIAGQELSGSELITLFKKKAPAGGFIRTEGSAPARMRFFRGTQNAYEAREEWVRLAHFLHAFDDELRISLRRGRSLETAKDIASEQAARRVAKWNIDYTAITPFERNIRKYAIPFYTWTRKATPLMFEAMMVRPGKIVHYDRVKAGIEQALGLPDQQDTQVVWPFWAEQAGKVRVTGGDEPFFVRDPAPINVVNRVFGGDQFKDPLANALNMTSPAIKMGVEVPTGQTIFNQQPITNWGEYFASQLPSASIAARAAGNPLQAGDTQTPDRSVAEQVLNLFGIPLQQNTYNRQRGELYRQMGSRDELFSQLNKALEPQGYSLRKTTSKTNGEYYILKNTRTDTIVNRFRDPVVALREVSGLLGRGA